MQEPGEGGKEQTNSVLQANTVGVLATDSHRCSGVALSLADAVSDGFSKCASSSRPAGAHCLSKGAGHGLRVAGGCSRGDGGGRSLRSTLAVCEGVTGRVQGAAQCSGSRRG